MNGGNLMVSICGRDNPIIHLLISYQMCCLTIIKEMMIICYLAVGN